jgi:hypothetical protein
VCGRVLDQFTRRPPALPAIERLEVFGVSSPDDPLAWMEASGYTSAGARYLLTAPLERSVPEAHPIIETWFTWWGRRPKRRPVGLMYIDEARYRAMLDEGAVWYVCHRDCGRDPLRVDLVWLSTELHAADDVVRI